MPCYSASAFPRAQAQLVTEGLNEDGYEAIHFALENVPFRSSPLIARNLMLITDEGRSVIPEGVNITRESIEQGILVCDITHYSFNITLTLVSLFSLWMLN